jgi:hypothetical protein
MELKTVQSPPSDVKLARLSQRVFDVLAEYTSFPWPVMQAQCRRVGVDPTNLSPEDLSAVTDYMAKAVERFTSPETGQKTREALRQLLR